MAILIGGMGSDGRASAEAATSLPGAVTFAFDASGPDLDAQARQARGAGHEVLLQWPKGDGAGGVAPPDRERARALLARFAGYVGVADPHGGRVRADAGDWSQILRDLGERGLIVVRDAQRQPRPDESGVASREPPVVRIDVVLDMPGDPTSIAQALTRLEAVARTHGIAAGSANADPATLAVLARYLATVGGRGFDLVPVSALARPTGANPVSFTRPSP